MKKNKIFALGLSAILGVSSIPTDIYALNNAVSSETESVEEKVENNENLEMGFQETESSSEDIQEEIQSNEGLQPEEDIQANENAQENNSQAELETEVQTDENGEILLPEGEVLNEKDKNTLPKKEKSTSSEIFHFKNGVITGLKNTSLTEITIPTEINGELVREIGYGAFYRNQNLKSVLIEGNVKIGERAFEHSNLERIEAPNVTEIGAYAFSNSRLLTSASFQGLTTINKSNIFSGCINLSNVSLPNLTELSSTTFFNCSNLSTLDLPELTTITGNSTFEGCSNLSNISLPKLTTITGNSTFNNCTSLQTLDLPELTTLNVDTNQPELVHGYTFKNCSNLSNINVPKLISIGKNTFVGASSLSEILLNSNVQIEDSKVFSNNTTIYIPRFEDSSNLDRNKNTWGAGNVKYHTINLVIKDSNLNKISETNFFDPFQLNEEKLNELLGDAQINKGTWKIEKDGAFETIKLPYEINKSTVLVHSSMLENEIQIRGRGLEGHKYTGFNVNFNTSTMKLNVNGMLANSYQIHDLIPNNVYTEIKLYNKNGSLKQQFSMKGKDLVRKALEINNMSFEFGDFIEVYHIQHTNYVTGNIKNKTPGKRNTYLITETGLEQVSEIQYKNTIQLRAQNIHGSKNHGFDLKFNKIKMTINVDMKQAYGYIPLHNFFGKSKYIEVKLYDKNGSKEPKNTLTLYATQSALNANKFNNTEFQFGDYIEIYHAEGKGWRYNVTGNIIDKSDKKSLTYLYRITENGLQQVTKKLDVPNVTPDVDGNNNNVEEDKSEVTPDVDGNNNNIEENKSEVTPELGNNNDNIEENKSEVTPELGNNNDNIAEDKSEVTPDVDSNIDNIEEDKSEVTLDVDSNIDNIEENKSEVVVNSVAPVTPNNDDINSDVSENNDVILNNEETNISEKNVENIQSENIGVEQQDNNIRYISNSFENNNLVATNLRDTISRNGIASGVQEVLSTVGITEENIENIDLNELENAISKVEDTVKEVNNSIETENIEVEKPAFGFNENSNMNVSLLIVLLLALLILTSIYVIKKQQKKSNEELEYTE